VIDEHLLFVAALQNGNFCRHGILLLHTRAPSLSALPFVFIPKSRPKD
jgi:hypothetical protein